MAKLKAGTIIPTKKEDAFIDTGINADPDNKELSNDFLKNTKTASDFFEPETYSALLSLKKKRGRPKLKTPTVFTAIRLDGDLVEIFKGTGKGLQTRVNEALRQFLIEHPIIEKETL